MTPRTDPNRKRQQFCLVCFDQSWRRDERLGCLGCGEPYEAERIEPAFQQLASSIAGMESL